MKVHEAKKVSLAVMPAAILIFVIVSSTSLPAQQRRVDARSPSTPEARARTEHQVTMDIEREALLKGSVPKGSADQRQLRALAAQIKEDFERLWSINQELMAAASIETGPECKYFLDRAAEVRSRAIRLQNTLSLPRPEPEDNSGKNQDARTGEELRAILFRLNTVIVNFVTNPYFRNPKVFDPGLVAKASRDLKDIIQLSRSLRKNCERLNPK